MVFNRSLLLVECSMLNCLSVFPLSEFASDSVKLLLSVLYSHLEKFPNIAGSHGSVSIVDAVTDRLKDCMCVHVCVCVCACVHALHIW